ncbi:hypothetical protein VTN77DRAFT_615 [Rasamsonia byssochlamydoides]|uniref:uncharacterized protein n=1 Tax=Rasamsonia byssochlamydoides TaxID=89139 RepID=UPI0037444C6C
MEIGNQSRSSPGQLGRIGDRLSLYQHQLSASLSQPLSSASTSSSAPGSAATTMSRDPITCHVLNTLTGTPAANLPCTLTLLSSTPTTFHATTDSDGRIKTWTPSSSNPSATVPALLSSLPSPDSKTNWAIRFDVGPWFEAQGVESFWPEVEVKFTVRGRGREGEEGWRHYHVPVLLGPWSYSTYRGS